MSTETNTSPDRPRKLVPPAASLLKIVGATHEGGGKEVVTNRFQALDRNMTAGHSQSGAVGF
jgi:hypothetical protein